ncbi:MAG: hypothetical protein Q9165_006211 [Trypethelium subeluteriae]
MSFSQKILIRAETSASAIEVATASAGGDGTNDGGEIINNNNNGGSNDGGQFINNQNGGVTTIFQTQTQTQTQFQTQSIEATTTDTETAKTESMNEISTLTVISTVTTASSSEAPSSETSSSETYSSETSSSDTMPLTGTRTSSLPVATVNTVDSSHNRLLGGEIAGIVIGACAALILLLALVWLVLRRRLRSSVKDGSQSSVVERWGNVVLADPNAKRLRIHVEEIERRELGEETGRQEFDAETERRELGPETERKELAGQIPYRIRDHLQECETSITRHELPGASTKERM